MNDPELTYADRELPDPLATTTEVGLLHAHLRGEHANERVEGCRACGGLPPVKAEVDPPLRKNTRGPSGAPTGRKCRCGCGGDVKRRFLPGHDAKLKSALVKRARQNDEAAARELSELGWGHFV